MCLSCNKKKKKKKKKKTKYENTWFLFCLDLRCCYDVTMFTLLFIT